MGLVYSPTSGWILFYSCTGAIYQSHGSYGITTWIQNLLLCSPLFSSCIFPPQHGALMPLTLKVTRFVARFVEKLQLIQAKVPRGNSVSPPSSTSFKYLQLDQLSANINTYLLDISCLFFSINCPNPKNFLRKCSRLEVSFLKVFSSIQNIDQWLCCTCSSGSHFCTPKKPQTTEPPAQWA